MENSDKIVFLDIDHTIFNTRLYSSLCYLEVFKLTGRSDSEEFISICQGVYRQIREFGPFNVNRFVQALSKRYSLSLDLQKVEAIFANKEIIQQALYDDVEKVLQELSGHGIKLGIFSTGPINLQRAKINSLLHLFQEEHIHINEVDKLQDISTILKRHSEEQVYIVDDLKMVLSSIKLEDASVITIFIDRNDKIKKEDLIDFVPEYTISTFGELKNTII
jgi:FMN phosphatase YigB (HAD superfamily)